VTKALLPALDDVAAVAGNGAGATIRIGAGPGGSVGTTICHWDRRMVVTRRLLIDLFELKFDYLNTNSIV
jgi:hypothetical protein